MTQLAKHLTRFITTRLSEADYSRLVQISVKIETPKTVLVREAIICHLSKFTKDKSASASTLA